MAGGPDAPGPQYAKRPHGQADRGIGDISAHRPEGERHDDPLRTSANVGHIRSQQTCLGWIEAV